MNTWLKSIPINEHVGLLVKTNSERQINSLIPYLLLKKEISMLKICSVGEEMQQLFSIQ